MSRPEEIHSDIIAVHTIGKVFSILGKVDNQPPNGSRFRADCPGGAVHQESQVSADWSWFFPLTVPTSRMQSSSVLAVRPVTRRAIMCGNRSRSVTFATLPALLGTSITAEMLEHPVV